MLMVNSRSIRLILLSWFAMIGVDFFLHAAVLAAYYVEPHPGLLAPQDAFRLIPVGYLAFLILAILLFWLINRLEISYWQAGFTFGLRLGMLTWGALILGLISIANLPLGLLAGWFIGQSIELAIGGAVIAYGLHSNSLKRLALYVFILILSLLVITVFLQSTGIVPSVRIV